MPRPKKNRATRAVNLLQNLSDLGSKTKRALGELSPQKLRKWLTPRKRQKGAHGPHSPNTEDASMEDATRLNQDAIDASDDDPFLVYPLADFTLVTPDAAPKARVFTWKLPRPTVEEVEDEDDRLSTYTFPRPNQSCSLHGSPSTPPSSPPPSSPPASEDNDLDLADVLETEDELLATSALFHDDDYPRPRAPQTFVERMEAHAKLPGVKFQAPIMGEARAALADLKGILRGELRGTDLFGRDGVGYKDPGHSPFTRNRLTGIHAILEFYTTPDCVHTYGKWGESALLAAHSLGRGKHCARVFASLTRQFIQNREVMDVNPYGEWNESMLADEDLADDIRLHLQSLGKNITVEKLQEYLNRAEVRVEHGIDKEVSLTTCRRYLNELGYRHITVIRDFCKTDILTIRFTCAKKGQYVDGHEREDVVYYRDHVYLPRLFKLHNRVQIFDNDGEPVPMAFSEAGRRVIIWYHDESIFYAHDRRRNTWYHKDSTAMPYQKGEGHSYMVADFFSADFGWLHVPHNPGRNARRYLRPGKNRDGYFTSVEVCEQAAAAVRLVNDLWPDYDHIFVYDNATTHKKRPEGSLSALKMPKGPSGQIKGRESANFLVEVNKLDSEGCLTYDSRGNLVKHKIQMTGASFSNGSTQDLYYPELPDDHPDHHLSGKFKGMKQILEERGLDAYAKLRAECPNFKCADQSETATCCCRRVLFNQPDFAGAKSILEEECEREGVEVLFLPKFHCELNPIEMVWGYAKRIYRLKPESSREDALEKNTMDSLDAVPLLLMRRFVNRCFRFGDAYYNHKLTGPQAAWIAKRYPGHRTYPAGILAQLDAVGV